MVWVKSQRKSLSTDDDDGDDDDGNDDDEYEIF